MKRTRTSLHALLAIGAMAAPTLAQEETEAPSVQVEELRGHIHEMRMNLILGGDDVKSAESEAIGFYNQKIGIVDQRMDSLRADLTEKRAVYDMALDQALGADDAAARQDAMERAQELREELTSLENEQTDLDEKRSNLGGLVGAVEQRGRERDRLAARLETVDDLDEGFGLTMGSVGLAPPAIQRAPSSPLEDDAFIRDLLERDPRRARELLFESDPDGYWERFPLRPPADALKPALVFPLPDLPGRR